MNTPTRVLLVALRLAVGWHFLYEGLFKIESDTGAAPYAPARFPIQAATARLRDAPDRVDAWNDELVRVFKGRQPLSEDQKARLNDLSEKIRSSGSVDFDWTYVHEEVLKIAPEPEPERFSSLSYLQNSAGPLRGFFRSLVRDIDGYERLTAASVEKRIDARYAEMLAHVQSAGKPFSDAQRTQLIQGRDAVKAAAVETVNSAAFQTRLADYRRLRERVKKDESNISAAFTRERVDAARKKLDLIETELLAFVNEPLSELAVQMQSIATPAQLAAGPLKRPADGAAWIDHTIEYLLTAIGVCLMLGLLTPVAAVAAAGQLLLFYLASPPWPNLPAAVTAGHYLYIDRNFIEALVALLIAVTPTGRWAGLDAYLFRERGSSCFSMNNSAKLEETISVTR